MESFSEIITMNLKYEITLEDYLEYYRSQSKYSFSHPWVRWILRPFIIKLALICGIGGIWYAIAYYAYYSDEFKYLISSIAIGCFCLGAGIGLLFVFSPEFVDQLSYIGFKKNYQEKPSLIDERNISIHKNELTLEAENFKIFLIWQVFKYLSETDNLFVLYFRGKEFQLIPKRCFENSEQIDLFRKLLHDRGKNLNNNSVITEKISEKDCILKLEYKLKTEDYLEAKQAANFPKKWFILFSPIPIVVIFCFGFYNLWKGIYRIDLLPNNTSSGDAIANGFLGLGMGFYFLLTQYPKINIFQRRKIARNWHNNPEMQSPRKLLVTEKEIVLMTDYFQESIAWQEYIKLIEKTDILLYYSQEDYQIVPKKVFKSKETMNQF